jgi:hypothetical protein
MPVAEIAAAVTGIRSALDITKAMVGLRDAEAFRAKSIELQGVVLEALDKAIEARESHAAQGDRIRALEAEVANLKAWDTEKQRYNLKSIGQGAVAYILKPEERSGETPHWLCPNCFAKGQKAFLQNTGRIERARVIVGCNSCRTAVPITKDVTSWADF